MKLDRATYWGLFGSAEGHNWSSCVGTGTQTIVLLVVPRELNTSVLEQVQHTITAGHLGHDKILQKLCLRCYWHGMATDVRLHVTTCAPCNQSKVVHRKPQAPMTVYQAGLPRDRLHLDMLGSFCESGNRCVLMAVDQFTRWLELVPLPAQDAESVAQVFFENYVVQFGVPLMVHTDKGRNFEGDLLAAFCDLLEAAKTRTTPYWPSANG